MAEITNDHIHFLDTFYEAPRSNEDIGDDPTAWAMIDDLVAAGYLDDHGDDGEDVEITQAGIDLLDSDDGEDEEEEGEPAVYRTYWVDAEVDMDEQWATVDEVLWACNDYLKNGAEEGDARVQLLETGEEWDIYEFLEAHVEG